MTIIDNIRKRRTTPQHCKDKVAMSLLKQLFWMLEIDVPKIAKRYNINVEFKIYKFGEIQINALHNFKESQRYEHDPKFNPFEYDILIVDYKDVLYSIIHYDDTLAEVERHLKTADSHRKILALEEFKEYRAYEHFNENFKSNGDLIR